MRLSSDPRTMPSGRAADAVTRKRIASRARPGFVLLEALVALAIVGTISIALLAATAAQVRTAGKAAHLLTAQSLAQERMAVLRSLEYDGLTAPPDSILEGTFPEPFADYTWRAEIATVDGEYDLFTAAVLVSGEGEEFALRTLLHEPQPQFTTGGEREVRVF
ncbi:MAG TPA: hypothetical protein VHG09_06260 [Longimicrobiales bacterium]|nr:hypothetical protein [Longimicrobiales bacterium]